MSPINRKMPYAERANRRERQLAAVQKPDTLVTVTEVMALTALAGAIAVAAAVG